MKEFGKIDTFLIFVAYYLNRLTFTFQIIKCPYVWENQRYQNVLWLHSKYLKYEIQKIHFELGHPVEWQDDQGPPPGVAWKESRNDNDCGKLVTKTWYDV